MPRVAHAMRVNIVAREVYAASASATAFAPAAYCSRYDSSLVACHTTSATSDSLVTARVDGRPARDESGGFTFDLLRAIHARGGHGTDGVSARLAHGRREGSASSRRSRALRSRRTRGLWVGEHLQHGVRPLRGSVTGPLRACELTDEFSSRSSSRRHLLRHADHGAPAWRKGGAAQSPRVRRGFCPLGGARRVTKSAWLLRVAYPSPCTGAGM